MKRIIALFVSLILVCACCVITANAESYSLIPSSDKADGWVKTACQGYNIEIEYTDEAIVFSAESVWPCADFNYDDEDLITVSVEDYSLVYDFTVETGCTNINFTFTDGFGSNATYSISNNSLGDVYYDPGSGDLMAADYKGAVRLSDFVNSTMFLQDKAFPSDIVVDGNLTFSAIQVYSVSGATVTIRELSLVPNDEIPDEPIEESSEEPAESSEEPADESSEEPAVESEDEATAESTVESATESTEESQDVEPTEDDGLGVWLWVIIGAAVVVVVIVIVIIAKKKK